MLQRSAEMLATVIIAKTTRVFHNKNWRASQDEQAQPGKVKMKVDSWIEQGEQQWHWWISCALVSPDTSMRASVTGLGLD